MEEEHFEAHVFEPSLVCSECGRTWDNPSERWRVRITDADEAVSYCPECARRNFDD